jgi:hypothetical protein
MADPPLKKCPHCGAPCKRAPSVFSPGAGRADPLRPENLAAKGFTQYTKRGKGYYEKTAGEGPTGIVKE